MTDSKDIRAYVARGWGEASESKERRRARRATTGKPGEAARLARSLGELAYRRDPGLAWSPSRDLDLDAHLRLKELIDRVGAAMSTR